MMPGVAAQPLGRRLAGDTALASADFRTGAYSVAGVAVLLADIVDQPELVDATGLALAQDANVVAMLGAFRDALLGGGSYVLEWDHFDATGAILPLVLADSGRDNALQIKRQNSFGSHFMNVQDFAGVNSRSTTDAGLGIGDGVHKIAVTRTDTKLVFSIDGRPVVTAAGDPLDFSIAPTDACFGGYPGDTSDALTIRSIRLLAAVDDSLLPALSA